MKVIAVLMAMAAVAVGSCESTRPAGAPLTPTEVGIAADRLDGKRIVVRGWIRVSGALIGIQQSPDPESACIGLFVRESQFERLTSFNETWGEVAGTLDADGCDPATNFCHDVCGPSVLLDPNFPVVE